MGGNYSNQHQKMELERKAELEREKKVQLEQQGRVNTETKEQTNGDERLSNLNNPRASFNTNEEKHQYKNILKTLYKNNLTSLTFEDMNAFFIQMNWKHFIIARNEKIKRGMIDVIFTKIDSESNPSQRRLFDILEIKEYPFRQYDLVKYKGLRKIIKECGGYENLPAIFINNYYIGSTEDFKMLEDNNYVNQILNKEYERRCIECLILKTNPDQEVCSFCFSSYLFFVKNQMEVDIWDMRNKENKEDNSRKDTPIVKTQGTNENGIEKKEDKSNSNTNDKNHKNLGETLIKEGENGNGVHLKATEEGAEEEIN